MQIFIRFLFQRKYLKIEHGSDIHEKGLLRKLLLQKLNHPVQNRTKFYRTLFCSYIVLIIFIDLPSHLILQRITAWCSRKRCWCQSSTTQQIQPICWQVCKGISTITIQFTIHILKLLISKFEISKHTYLGLTVTLQFFWTAYEHTSSVLVASRICILHMAENKCCNM